MRKERKGEGFRKKKRNSKKVSTIVGQSSTIQCGNGPKIISKENLVTLIQVSVEFSSCLFVLNGR